MSAPSPAVAPPTTARLVRHVLVAFLPSAVAGAWLFVAGTGLRGPALLQAVPWLVLLGAVAAVQLWLTSGSVVSHATAASPGEAPDAWLARFAELPRNVEIFAIGGAGVVAGALAGAISALVFGAHWAVVPLSAAVGLVLSLVPGVAGFAAVEREVRSFASEHAARQASSAGGTSGFLRMRHRVHLPYALGAAAVAPVVAAVVVLSTRGAGASAAAEALGVAAVLIAGACAAGRALADRQADASEAISAALTGALAGGP
ncbi:MAG TPA: hypothetical protein VD838_12135, partial [Anaeromyxobacteraceae bacterium]|nr:hypothetical protein [Anaeromyxobacteraceae bacterium]